MVTSRHGLVPQLDVNGVLARLRVQRPTFLNIIRGGAGRHSRRRSGASRFGSDPAQESRGDAGEGGHHAQNGDEQRNVIEQLPKARGLRQRLARG